MLLDSLLGMLLGIMCFILTVDHGSVSRFRFLALACVELSWI